MNRRWIPISVALGVMLLGLATGWAGAASELPGAPSTLVAIADVAAGWSFAVVGALLWIRYPHNRVGLLTVAVGLASFLADIRWFATPLTWTLGSMLTDVHLLVLGWLILAFPTGRLGRGERMFVIASVTYFVVLAIAGHLFEPPVPGCAECPDSLLLVREDPALNDRIWGVGQVLNLVLVGVLVGMILRKWARATPPARRALAPVMWALGPIGLALAVAFLEQLIGFGDTGAQVVLVVERLALIVFPLALLAGMVQTTVARARVGDLARALDEAPDPDELERLVGEALGDPSARLAFWSDERLIDAAGAETAASAGQATTDLERNGEQLGAVFHDPQVDPALIDAVGATAGLALHNERLRAELRARLAEVAASRERIAQATLAERRRLERDLHDGAQQRLLALGALLGQIRMRSNGDTGPLLDEAIDELRGTIDELRELARGVHPAILTERGLAAAVRALAERSPLPVEVDMDDGRFRPATEAAAYFLVSEALTNAIRHADATAVRIRGHEDGASLVVEVLDDGSGGADPEAGTGIQGLADRMGALGGALEVRSRPGGGTAVVGTLPCE